MRIDRLDLLSYGHLREQSLDLSQPAAGLTLVVGPNEAGKSTTLRAIKALLFGIERGTADDYRMGRESLRVGAAVRDDGGTVIEVIRQGLARAPLVTPDGESVDEAALAALVGGVERALFAALFCIDHDELHERSAELLDPDAEIGRLVFGASLGATTLTGVLKELQAKAAALYKPQGSNQRVARSLSQARELRRQVREIRVRARDWEELELERRRLEKDAAALRAESAGLRGRDNYLERLISALPMLAKRSGLRERMGELELGGAVQTGAWAAAVDLARARLQEAEAEHRRSLATRVGLESRLAGMPASSPLLLAAERIDERLQGLGRFKKDKRDLPGLEGQSAASGDALARLLERLGMSDSTTRRVTDAQLVVVDELAQARAALEERLASAQAEVEALVEGIERAEREVRELPEAPDVEGLARVVAVGRTFLERERQAGRERAEIEGLSGDVKAGALRLGLDGADFDALECLPAPALSALRDHRLSQVDLGSRRASLEQRIAELDGQENDLSARRDEILSDSSVPDPGDVEAARARRDEGWSLVRAAWLAGDVDDEAVQGWAGDSPLEDAFEASVHDADGRADARFQHATQLANLEQIAIASAGLLERRTGCDANQREIAEAAARLDEEWRVLWEPTGVCPGSVDEGEEWLSGLSDMQRAAADHRRRVATLEELEKEVAAQCSAARAAMAEIGLRPDAASLALLIEQADVAISEARAAAEERTAAGRAIAQGKAARPRREEAVKLARAALADWEQHWAEAVAAVGMTAKTGIGAGRETLRLLREYRGELSNAEGLRGRVDGLQADIDKYAASVTELLKEAAPELAELDADRALAELKPRLDEARKESRLRDDLVSQMEPAKTQVGAADEELQEARRSLLRLREQAGLGPEADLALEAQRASQHAALHETVREVEETLVAQGGGLTLKDLLAAVKGDEAGEGELKARLDGVKADIEDVEERLEVVNRQYGAARTKLASLDHGGQAAQLEQDAELEFAAVAEHVSEYARVALAVEVLRRVVADYGQRNQGPIVEFASRNFRMLTDGAFDSVFTDLVDDKQLLLARRRNGEVLHSDQLSEGTVDQLYLALRLAGVEHHLTRSAKSPPVILDDILVNFDDARAASALRLFAELGRRAQVLLFTHHRHVSELAVQVLPADQVHVAELSARDHSAPVETPQRPPARARSRGGERAAAGAANQAAIIGVLEKARGPLGKADILGQAGIPDSAWMGAIRALVDRGVVVQEGAKRGARYRLGGGGSPDE